MIWRKYRNEQLAIHVEQRNRHNKIVNELAILCASSLANFSDQKIQNADGKISKKIGEKISSAMSMLHPRTNDLLYVVGLTKYNVYLWAKSCYQLNHETFYVEGEVCVGDLDGRGFYAPRKALALLKTNFDAEIVLTALNEMDDIESRLTAMKSHLSDFITQRD